MKINNLILILSSIIILILLLPQVDSLLDRTMYLNLLIQIPGFILCGFAAGHAAHRRMRNGLASSINDTLNKNGLSGLIFFIGSAAFWMIPRSVDMTVYSDAADYLMQLNLFLAGFILGFSMNSMPFIVKTGAGIYGLAMWFTAGYVYYVYESLICAVYDLEMQKLTGKLFLMIFPGLFIFFLIRTFKNLIVHSKPNSNEV